MATTLTSGNTVPENEWTHVLWYGANSRQYIYLNGVDMTASYPHVSNIDSHDDHLTIGRYDYKGGGASRFNGSIDEVILMNKTPNTEDI